MKRLICLISLLLILSGCHNTGAFLQGFSDGLRGVPYTPPPAPVQVAPVTCYTHCERIGNDLYCNQVCR